MHKLRHPLQQFVMEKDLNIALNKNTSEQHGVLSLMLMNLGSSLFHAFSQYCS
jgi:hypothetical protein